MANFKTTNDQAYPTTADNKLTENDPMIVKVPMADMGWGATKSMMAKVKGETNNGELGIKHVEAKKGP